MRAVNPTSVLHDRLQLDLEVSITGWAMNFGFLIAKQTFHVEFQANQLRSTSRPALSVYRNEGESCQAVSSYALQGVVMWKL